MHWFGSPGLASCINIAHLCGFIVFNLWAALSEVAKDISTWGKGSSIYELAYGHTGFRKNSQLIVFNCLIILTLHFDLSLELQPFCVNDSVQVFSWRLQHILTHLLVRGSNLHGV